MEKFYGNYLGLCINNNDPDYRGRVQIFIPHIMPALYDRWNKAGTDRKIEIIGNNLENALPQEDVEQLKKMLPWAEAASPIFGNSVAGHYNPQSGNFNQSYGTEGETIASINSNPTPTSIADLGAERQAYFANQLQDPNILNRLAFLATREVDQADTNVAQQTAFLETVFNRTQFSGSNFSTTLFNSYWGSGAGSRPISTTTSQAIANVLGGSNITNFATDNASNAPGNPVADNRIAAGVTGNWFSNGQTTGYNQGEFFYRANGSGGYSSTAGLRANEYARRFENVNALTDPAAGSLPGSSNPAQSSPFLNPQPGPYTSISPDQQAVLDAAANTVANQGQLPGTLPGSGVATSGDSRIGGGSTGNKLSEALSVARQTISNTGRPFKGYTNSYGGYCHVGTSSLVSVCLGNPNQFGSGVASAKQAIGSNYWTKGGYYEVLHASGSSKTGYKPQEGDIAISTGGQYGHVKAVVGGQFRSDNINDSAANVLNQSTEIYRLTEKGRQAWADAGYGDAGLLGEALPDNPKNNIGIDPNADGTSIASPDIPAGMHQTTTSTQPTVTDTTGMPQGLFSVPNPGAMLWVFFREGDPLFPVYFAASYGAREWKNAFKATSPGAHYPNEGDTTPRNQAIFRPNQAGGLTFTDTITDQEDTRSIRMFHANGAHLEMHLNGSTFYSPNEHIQQVAGNHFNSCLNRETWTQGKSNSVTIGDRITIVGNMSEEAVAAIEEHAKIVKDINKNMLKGG